LESGKAAPSEATPNWTRLPDEQAWYWHWNGEDYSAPFIHSVLASLTGSGVRYFVQYPDSRWCDEVGGWWMKIDRPNVPSRDWLKQAATPDFKTASLLSPQPVEGKKAGK
jgi:hypothetical protein